jgi:glycosyltransferase involved in cell wall biosynthesis
MKLLVVEGRHPRNRSRFLVDPLSRFPNIDVSHFRFEGNLAKSIVKSARYAYRNGEFNYVIVCGANICGTVWYILNKSLIGGRFILRLGGNPITSVANGVVGRGNAIRRLVAGLITANNVFLLRNTRDFFVVSQVLANEIRKLSGNDSSVYVVPQYVGVSEATRGSKPENDYIRLLSVTNLNFYGKYKGVSRLIELLIRRQGHLHRPVELHICGGGTYFTKLKREFGQMRYKTTNATIFLHGFENEIFKYYEMADIFVYASYIDGLPNTILEAMSFGLPIIMNKELRSNIQIETPKNCLLFDMKTQEDLVDKINRLVKDKTLCMHMTKNNKELISQRYCIRAVGNRLKEILDSLESGK